MVSKRQPGNHLPVPVAGRCRATGRYSLPGRILSVHPKPMRRFTLISWLLCMPFCLLAQPPVADMHLHYKWTQQDVTSPANAIAILDEENIVMGVVIGTPAELALALQSLAGERIVPIFSPYREGGDWHRWAYDETTVTRARMALASGQYRGIGELHVVGGFAPTLEKAVVLKQLLRLAAEFDVPIMIHTEFSRPDFMLKVCQQFPDTRILWAHSGALLPPEAVDRVLEHLAMYGVDWVRAIPGAL